MRTRSLISLLALLCLFTASLGAQETSSRLLRFPDVEGDRIVFVYGGDLWTVPVSGGSASRLTSHRGQELFPKFSPDGRWIAYSAEYSGSRQIYVIPAAGGQPRQLTFYNDVGSLPPRGGYDYQVLDWTPDGRDILIRANRTPWGERMGKPFLVPVAGGMERALPMPHSGGGMFSPDGTRLVYTPIDREFRTWKHYRGGRAQDVWIYDLARNTSEQITNDPATDNQPLWVGDTIYFTSDRDWNLNLYSWDAKTRETRKVTTHQDYDVLFPSAGRTAIVYEAGGYIHHLNPTTGTSQRVEIRLQGDFEDTLPYFKNVKSFIQSMDLSPTGARALFASRGDIFTVPAKEGEIRNLTASPDVREIDPAWSPDGRWIAYWSDRSGEYELYVRDQDGSSPERRVTTGGDIWRFPAVWSPDSKRLAFADKKQTLRVVDASTGAIKDVDRGTHADITTYTWSPDSRWIAYTKAGENGLNAIWIYSQDSGTATRLTSGQTDDYGPVFDPEGRYLYFLSNRDFNLTFSGFEFNYIYTNPTRVYVGILSKEGPGLFLPSSDEEKAKEEEKAKTAGAAAKSAEKSPDAKIDALKSASKNVTIDLDGFESRVRAIPGAPGDYRALSANDRGVLYLTGEGGASKLSLFDITEKKEETILEGIGSYQLSGDGEKVIFRKGADYGIASSKAGQKTSDGLLALDNMEMKIVPRAEWQNMYVDAWRIVRDWFYDPGMHGVDWQGMRKKYEPLVPHIATRADLDFVLGELVGELVAGHAYVNSGDQARVRRANSGLLGAEIVADPSGYFRIQRLLPGENWHESFRSPLTEPGVRVKAGEFIIAVDGVPANSVKNFYELLENKADRVVTLSINATPTAAGARIERVRPVTSEGNLRYLDWVRSRQEMVSRLSGGRIGYIHLPNTSTDGNRELFKYFYPQANKEALIFDDRFNGGGFIPDRMIELIDRPRLNYWARRGVEPDPTPGFAHDGPKAVLINGYSSSGGDAFPYYFRKRGLGKVIGTRTWGGLIGISSNPSLLDNGSVSVPSFRFLDTEGAWVIENEGVTPDIEVIDRPELIAEGKDPSLEKAVEVLLEELKRNPARKIVVPPAPRYPAPRP